MAYNNGSSVLNNWQMNGQGNDPSAAFDNALASMQRGQTNDFNKRHIRNQTLAANEAAKTNVNMFRAENLQDYQQGALQNERNEIAAKDPFEQAGPYDGAIAAGKNYTDIHNKLLGNNPSSPNTNGATTLDQIRKQQAMGNNPEQTAMGIKNNNSNSNLFMGQQMFDPLSQGLDIGGFGGMA